MFDIHEKRTMLSVGPFSLLETYIVSDTEKFCDDGVLFQKALLEANIVLSHRNAWTKAASHINPDVKQPMLSIRPAAWQISSLDLLWIHT
jgi:hypothetical protein